MAAGALKARWDAAKEVLGHRRYLLAPLFGAIIGFVDWALGRLEPTGIRALIGLPSWAIGLFAALLLVVWWFLEDAVQLRKRISGTRVGLSELRKEGVDLRNRGRQPLPDKVSWEAWKKNVEDWNTRVIAKIKEVNEADAIWFSVLDVVPPPRIPPFASDPTFATEPWGEERTRLYSWHDLRVMRLGEMIQQLWRD